MILSDVHIILSVWTSSCQTSSIAGASCSVAGWSSPSSSWRGWDCRQTKIAVLYQHLASGFGLPSIVRPFEDDCLAVPVLTETACPSRRTSRERSPACLLRPAVVHRDDCGPLSSLLFFLCFPLVLACVVLDSRGSRADLAGPPHRPPRGFLCRSPASLSGPPRRGPLGTFPRDRLSSTTTGRCQRGALTTATGGPLRGIGRNLHSPGRCSGGGCQSLRRSSPKKRGRHCLDPREPWTGLLGGALEYHLASLHRTGLHPGGLAGLHPANLGGVPRLQRLGRGFALPSGRPPRGPGPTLLGRAISDLQTWILQLYPSYSLFTKAYDNCPLIR